MDADNLERLLAIIDLLDRFKDRMSQVAKSERLTPKKMAFKLQRGDSSESHGESRRMSQGKSEDLVAFGSAEIERLPTQAALNRMNTLTTIMSRGRSLAFLSKPSQARMPSSRQSVAGRSVWFDPGGDSDEQQPDFGRMIRRSMSKVMTRTTPQGASKAFVTKPSLARMEKSILKKLPSRFERQHTTLRSHSLTLDDLDADTPKKVSFRASGSSLKSLGSIQLVDEELKDLASANERSRGFDPYEDEVDDDGFRRRETLPPARQSFLDHKIGSGLISDPETFDSDESLAAQKHPPVRKRTSVMFAGISESIENDDLSQMKSTKLQPRRAELHKVNRHPSAPSFSSTDELDQGERRTSIMDEGSETTESDDGKNHMKILEELGEDHIMHVAAANPDVLQQLLDRITQYIKIDLGNLLTQLSSKMQQLEAKVQLTEEHLKNALAKADSQETEVILLTNQLADLKKVQNESRNKTKQLQQSLQELESLKAQLSSTETQLEFGKQQTMKLQKFQQEEIGRLRETIRQKETETQQPRSVDVDGDLVKSVTNDAFPGGIIKLPTSRRTSLTEPLTAPSSDTIFTLNISQHKGLSDAGMISSQPSASSSIILEMDKKLKILEKELRIATDASELLGTLECQIKQIQYDLRIANEEKDKLNAIIDNLKREIEGQDLQERLESANQQLEDTFLKMRHLREKLSNAEKEIARVENKANAAIANRNSMIDDLKNIKDVIEAELSVIKEQHEGEMKKKEEEFEAIREEALKNLATSQHLNEFLEKERENLNSQIQQLELEVKNLREDLKKNAKKIEDKTQHIQDIMIIHQHTEDQLKDAQTNLEKFEAKNKYLESQLLELQKLRDAQLNSISEHSKEYDELKKLSEQKEQEFKCEISKYEFELGLREKEISELNEKLKLADNRYTTTSELYTNKIDELNELRNSFQRSLQESQDLNEKICIQFKLQIEKLEAKIQQLERGDTDLLEEEIRALKSQLERALFSATEQTASLNDELRRSEEKIATFILENDSLKSQISQVNLKIEHMTQVTRNKDQDIDSLKQQLHDQELSHKSEVYGKDQIIAGLKLDIKKTRLDLISSQSTIDDLKNQISTLETTVGTSATQYEQLRKNAEEVALLQAANLNLERQIDNLKLEIDTTLVELKNQHSLFLDEQSKRQHHENRFEQQQKEFQTRIFNLVTDCENLIETLRNKEDIIKELEEEKSKRILSQSLMQKDLDNLKSTVIDVCKEKEITESQLREVFNKVKEWEANANAMSSTINGLQEKLTEAERQLDSAQKALKEKNSRPDQYDVDARIKEVEALIAKANDNNQIDKKLLIGRLDLSQTENKRLRARLSSLMLILTKLYNKLIVLNYMVKGPSCCQQLMNACCCGDRQIIEELDFDSILQDTGGNESAQRTHPSYGRLRQLINNLARCHFSLMDDAATKQEAITSFSPRSWPRSRELFRQQVSNHELSVNSPHNFQNSSSLQNRELLQYDEASIAATYRSSVSSRQHYNHHYHSRNHSSA